MENHKKAFTIGILLVILLSFPILLFTLRNRQDTRQRASEVTLEPGVEAVVGTKKITKQDVDALISMDQVILSPAALQNKSLRTLKLNLLIEDTLIKQQAQKSNITVTTNDVLQEKEDMLEVLPTLVAKDPSVIDANKLSNAVLKEKVINRVVNSRTIDQFIVNKSPESATYTTDLEKARESLELIRGLLLQGMSPQDAYAQAKKNRSFDTQIQFIEGVVITGDTRIAKRFKDAILSLKKGDVSQVTDSLGGTLMIAKAQDVNDTKYNSYADWLSAMKQQYVTTP